MESKDDRERHALLLSYGGTPAIVRLLEEIDWYRNLTGDLMQKLDRAREQADFYRKRADRFVMAEAVELLERQQKG